MAKGPTLTQRAQRNVYLALLVDTRLNAGLTQDALAVAAGVSQPDVSQVEAGKVRRDVVQLQDWLSARGSTLARFSRALERGLAK
ncbi:helix-turn-helix domain-containing protein [Luteibacter aegosomatissinici]|uniref:helix-turn-helix domain-containing protein n=1 Tax=Luteibacter aegosomatissinici TaxID=2911539 RepID=UPI001FFB6144|nr:helix-turn-helix domain-containing protein [Luteibacter aegosomatissinici]UPG92838.1 helix-turn-helix domain-containing protein [Luteibacter aegosomatissinici]